MKYLSLKSYFDLQKQRVFCVKSVLKKKQKKKFIYLFSKRQSSLVYVKPLYLDFQNILHFKKSGVACKQNNLYLRGLTGLPLNNVYIRYKYFDFSNVFDRVKFKERYNFEIFGNLRQSFNKVQIIKLVPKIKKKLRNFFYFVNIVYTFRHKQNAFKKNFKNKNILKYNKVFVALLKSKKFTIQNIKYYFIFFRTSYKKYLSTLNFKYFNLQSKLLKLNKYFLYTIDLLLFQIQKKIQFFVKSKLINNNNKITILQKINNNQIIVNKKHFKIINNVSCFLILRKLFFANSKKLFSKIKISWKVLSLYINNIYGFITKTSFLLKNTFLISWQFRLLLQKYNLFLKRLKKKKNLFFFNLFKNKTIHNLNTNTTFFFKNFVLYNIKFFKKYWKYYFKRKFKKNTLKKKKKVTNKISLNSFCGFRINKSGLNQVYSLYYFFSLLLNRKHWFYYYKTYMPILKLNYISSSNLDVNFKVNFFSWFKKHKLYSIYKTQLCFLNYKNKYVYMYFYNYLYFKQLAGLKYYNILNKLYLTNYAFFWNDYNYCYVDLTLQDTYSALAYNNKTPIVSYLKNNRINLIKNYLNVNIKFNHNLFKGNIKACLFDFSIDYLSIFAHNINSKLILYLQYLYKHKGIGISYNQTLLPIYFFFKLIGQILKKISYLKYIYFTYVVKKNKVMCSDLHLLKLNNNFIFDFFFLLYNKYLTLLKLLIFLLRYTL